MTLGAWWVQWAVWNVCVKALLHAEVCITTVTSEQESGYALCLYTTLLPLILCCVSCLPLELRSCYGWSWQWWPPFNEQHLQRTVAPFSVSVHWLDTCLQNWVVAIYNDRVYCSFVRSGCGKHHCLDPVSAGFLCTYGVLLSLCMVVATVTAGSFAVVLANSKLSFRSVCVGRTCTSRAALLPFMVVATMLLSTVAAASKVSILQSAH